MSGIRSSGHSFPTRQGEVKNMTVKIKKVEKPEISKVRGAITCG
jgi:hypothetical protein